MSILRSAVDLERLYRKACAERWNLARERLAEAIETSAVRALGERVADRAAIDRYLETLHLTDLAVACACADGHQGAWEHLVDRLRPVLYRAADAIDSGGGARDLADGLHAELFGLDARGRERPSLLRYYHGRSSLATWLRAVLAQRHVDRIREQRLVDSLPVEDPVAPAAVPPDPDRARWIRLASAALEGALQALEPRERLRLAAYYADGMTLAAIGRMMGEHEATVSRHLARARKRLRDDIERALAAEGLDPDEVAQCLESVTADPGTIDLGSALAQDARGHSVQGKREDT